MAQPKVAVNVDLRIVIRGGHVIVAGPLESLLLRALWRYETTLNGRASIDDIHTLVAAIGVDLAYTTVATTLDRLARKGLVERVKERHPRYGGQRHWRYRAALSAAALDAATLETAVAALIAAYGADALQAALRAARAATAPAADIII